MSPKIRTWAVSGLSFLIGSVLAGVVSVYLTSKFYMYGFYANELGRTTINIEASRALKEGNIEKAIKLLNTDIQASKILSGEIPVGTPEVTKKEIVKLRSLINKYESETK